jgi:hypothetical protein
VRLSTEYQNQSGGSHDQQWPKKKYKYIFDQHSRLPYCPDDNNSYYSDFVRMPLLPLPRFQDQAIQINRLNKCRFSA